MAAIFEDDNLYGTDRNENWQGQLKKLKTKLNISSLDINESAFHNSLKNYYINNVDMQLQNIEFSKSGKLLFYSKIRKKYELQDYLKFPIVKTVALN